MLISCSETPPKSRWTAMKHASRKSRRILVLSYLVLLFIIIQFMDHLSDAYPISQFLFFFSPFPFSNLHLATLSPSNFLRSLTRTNSLSLTHTHTHSHTFTLLSLTPCHLCSLVSFPLPGHQRIRGGPPSCGHLPADPHTGHQAVHAGGGDAGAPSLRRPDRAADGHHPRVPAAQATRGRLEGSVGSAHQEKTFSRCREGVVCLCSFVVVVVAVFLDFWNILPTAFYRKVTN